MNFIITTSAGQQTKVRCPAGVVKLKEIKMENNCEVRRCHGGYDIRYLGKCICWKHWLMFCRGVFDLKDKRVYK